MAGEGRRTETQDLRPLKVARKKSSDGFAVLAHAATNVRAAYSEDKGRRHEFEDLAVVTHDARGDKTTQLRVSAATLSDQPYRLRCNYSRLRSRVALTTRSASSQYLMAMQVAVPRSMRAQSSTTRPCMQG